MSYQMHIILQQAKTNFIIKISPDSFSIPKRTYGYRFFVLISFASSFSNSQTFVLIWFRHHNCKLPLTVLNRCFEDHSANISSIINFHQSVHSYFCSSVNKFGIHQFTSFFCSIFRRTHS